MALDREVFRRLITEGYKLEAHQDNPEWEKALQEAERELQRGRKVVQLPSNLRDIGQCKRYGCKNAEYAEGMCGGCLIESRDNISITSSIQGRDINTGNTNSTSRESLLITINQILDEGKETATAYFISDELLTTEPIKESSREHISKVLVDYFNT